MSHQPLSSPPIAVPILCPGWVYIKSANIASLNTLYIKE